MKKKLSKKEERQIKSKLHLYFETDIEKMDAEITKVERIEAKFKKTMRERFTPLKKKMTTALKNYILSHPDWREEGHKVLPITLFWALDKARRGYFGVDTKTLHSLRCTFDELRKLDGK